MQIRPEGEGTIAIRMLDAEYEFLTPVCLCVCVLVCLWSFL